ncbi:isopentenyl-diphosphate Delta-isomerase [Corynebacterium sp.]|uniref:isopentenyl-diphosphate Delta-isomerase n=1 Tax=Corynebacterium sp. TaxID=1720 RepID=UPI002A91E119|nr:isopentenyl-diphosphate Delta-isomerase [Corynebacterium sp.]MDY5785121.1 isopentenyl-diphosphate Delta-isomerase [Corynebacterium sp.]
MEREEVVLLNSAAEPIGTAFKDEVHTTETPLHLAFSCWLLSADGKLLMTRRALDKMTWPGTWTNSFCGHPGPSEGLEAALYRRAAQEIGLDPELIAALECAVPDFRYRTVDTSGIVENEVCPVFVARLSVSAADAVLAPSPAEVDTWEWTDPACLAAAAQAAPYAFSPWLVLELDHTSLRTALGL